MYTNKIKREFYINNACVELHEFKNISYVFKVIDIFKDKQDRILNNITTSEIVSKKIDKLPQIITDQKIYFSTDHHGDLIAFMFSLLESGVAKYKDNEDSVLYFNTLDGKIIENNIVDYDIKKIRNIIPIPNLEINKDFDGKFICGGDLIDRGGQSDVCFCLMYYLLNQDLTTNKIEYLVGNHEGMVFENNIQTLSMYDTPMFRSVGDYSFIKNLLIDLLNKDKLKFCISSGNTIFSHTIFEQLYIEKALNIIIHGKSFNDNKYYFLDYRYKEYFSKNEKLLARQLKEKIYYKEKLNSKDIAELSKLLNNLFKNRYIYNNVNITSNDYCDGIFLDNNSRDGLLWSRDFSTISEQITGLYQVVGHTPVRYIDDTNIALPVLKDNIIFADVMQSVGYNYELGNTDATMIYFENGKCFVEQKRIFEMDINSIFDVKNEIKDGIVDEKTQNKTINNEDNRDSVINRLIEFANTYKYDINRVEDVYILNSNLIKIYKNIYKMDIFEDYCIYDPDNFDYYQYLENKINSIEYLIKNEFIDDKYAKNIYNVTAIDNKEINYVINILYRFGDTILTKSINNSKIEEIYNNIVNVYDLYTNRDIYFNIFNNYIISKRMDMCKNKLSIPNIIRSKDIL